MEELDKSIDLFIAAENIQDDLLKYISFTKLKKILSEDDLIIFLQEVYN